MEVNWNSFVRLALLGLLSAASAAPPALADDWPRWRGPRGDGVWRETGIIDKFTSPQLPIVWRKEISAGYTGPTVADGRVFVADRVTEPKQIERVHCFDAATGSDIWSHSYDCVYRGVSYDAGPRAAITIDAGRAYSLGTMGHLFCWDAPTGEILWGHDLNTTYKIRMPTWGITAAPLVEGELVVVQIGGEGNACVVAFDKKTGRQRWKALPDAPSYSAPIAIDQAGKRVIVCWTAENVNGLDARTGKLYWRHPFPSKMAAAIPTPVRYKDRLFMTAFFDGSMMLRLRQDEPGVELVWHRAGASEIKSDALHSTMATPYIHDEHIYGVCSYGELRCLDAANGDRLWESLDAVPKARWANVHFVAQANRVWMFNDRGELIISRLSPEGFEEISRAKLIEPTTKQFPGRGGVCWSHPAFANKHVFARNDRELVCASLAK